MLKWGGVILFLFSQNARALMCIYWLSHNKYGIFHSVIKKILRSHYHIESSCQDIGERLIIPHPRNIIICAEKIGNSVQINQNVTIGGNMKKTKQREWGEQKLPIIGNMVTVCTNSVVGGPVIIGDNVILGANSTCTHEVSVDVEPNTLLYNTMSESKRKIEVSEGTYKYI